ncbi:MAG: lactonase family protein [Lentisphaeria bacterium]|nr:lactonase family protein [Lentisphaeria bacterium]
MDEKLFYLASRSTVDNSGGIYGMTVDDGGVITESFFHELYGTSYLAYSGDRKTLYASCAEGKTGAVAALKIKPDGSLEFLNRLASKGVSTCYVIAAPGGKYLYTASYFTSNVSEFSLNSDGSLKALERVITFSGKSVDVRQECPHPHFVNFTPDQSKLLVVDLGVDEIKLFDFDPEKGLLNINEPTVFKVEPAGSGPRHLVFNASGNMAYLVNEIGNTVAALSFDGSSFTPKQLISTLPDDCKCYSKTAAIRLSPDGKYLFVSNRGYDSIAVFKVKNDGSLERVDIAAAEGEGPRDINFLPGGKYFAAANEISGNTAFFAYSEKSGKLTFTGQSINMPGALAIYW